MTRPRFTDTPWFALIAMVLVALITRAAVFGNPVTDMDDQFYWIVGRNWWDGQWPILDIWDRKPIGLFLIYGAIAGVSRSIVAVQIAATFCAVATAWVIRKAALLFVGQRAALLSALLYLLWLPMLGGRTGQSPVFYNLFMAAAGYWLLAAVDQPVGKLIRHAYGSMALCGLALVVKQVSVAEGVFFGLAYLWLMRRHGMAAAELLFHASGMVATALLPTLIGFDLFAAKGPQALSDYAYAAYVSIFAKSATYIGSRINGLAYLGIVGHPVAIVAVIGWVMLRRQPANRLRAALLGGWSVAAIVGYLMVPNFFAHYALPMLVPLTIMASGLFERSSALLIAAGLALFALVTTRVYDRAAEQRAASVYAKVARAVSEVRGDGCLFVANGPMALYADNPHCAVTRIVFPYHLTLATEQGAIGVDQAAEIGRIFAARPSVVVTQDSEAPNQTAAVQGAIQTGLSANYRAVLRVGDDEDAAVKTLTVWKRVD